MNLLERFPNQNFPINNSYGLRIKQIRIKMDEANSKIDYTPENGRMEYEIGNAMPVYISRAYQTMMHKADKGSKYRII